MRKVALIPEPRAHVKNATDGVMKEGHPKLKPQPGWGLNQVPSGWQSDILPTVPTSHTKC